MSQAAAPAIPGPTTTAQPTPSQISRPRPEVLPVTPGKVAMWLFLATEVMFFTGLIGTYIVLRSGSPAGSYSNLYAPATNLADLQDKFGVVLTSSGADHEKVEHVLHDAAGLSEVEALEAAEGAHHFPQVVKSALTEAEAKTLATALTAAGATAAVEGLVQYDWPLPYLLEINPLSINLTAVNTFILICSSVTMVLALAAVQRGDQAKLKLFLGLTVAIGSVFLGIQVVEYYKLTLADHFSAGVSRSHHFRPSSSLFASCFFTMTGFHGMHVFGGIVTLACILIQALRGAYTAANHAAVEMAGLYWHFVDLVWIILFTVVYLI